MVTGLEIRQRTTILGGKAFGAAGAYEKITGTIRFAADPEHAVNRQITDIGLAPCNADGRVDFSGDFYLLKPVDPDRGNKRLLLELVAARHLLAEDVDAIVEHAGRRWDLLVEEAAATVQ